MSQINNLLSGVNVSGGGGNAMLGLIIVLALLLIGGMIYFIIWFSSFKHSVKIKEYVNDKKYLIIHDKAKRKKDNGAEFWYLRRRKALISAPPSDSLQITSRGNYYAECVHHEKSGYDSGYIWISPKNPVDKDGKEVEYTINITQEERAILADRLRRASNRRTRSVLDVISQLGGMFFVLIILIVVLSFYGKITDETSSAIREIGVVADRISNIVEQQQSFQGELNAICELPSYTGDDLPLDRSVGAN